MRAGVDILVATPGRLLDLMRQQASAARPGVASSSLDEADRMLDMGFIRDIRKIVATLPKQRQTLLFSATMPDEIAELARACCSNPVRVEVTPQCGHRRHDRAARAITSRRRRSARCWCNCWRIPALTRVIVFTRTKHGANKVAEHLAKRGVSAEAHPRQQVAGARASRRWSSSGPAGARAGGDRHRRARHRCHRHLARDQLRPAERARELRAPHRPHRARRQQRHRDLVLRSIPSARRCGRSSGSPG